MAVRQEGHDRGGAAWEGFWDKAVPAPADWTQEHPTRPAARPPGPAAHRPNLATATATATVTGTGERCRSTPGGDGVAAPRPAAPRPVARRPAATRPWSGRPAGRPSRPGRPPGPAAWYQAETLDGEVAAPGWYLGPTLDGERPRVRARPAAPVAAPAPERSAVHRAAAVVGQALALVVAAVTAWWVLVPLRGGPAGPGVDGVPGRIDTTVARTLLADQVLSVTAWAGYVSTTLVLGGLVYQRFVSRPATSRPAAGEPSPRRRRSHGDTLLWAAIGLGLVAVACAVPLRAAVVSGRGPAVLGDLEALAFVLRSPFGNAALLRATGLGVVAVSRVGGPLRPAAAITGWALVLASYLLVGHPQANHPFRLEVAAQAVHVAAVSVWFAGIAFLAVELRQRRRQGAPWVTGRVVHRFSRLAELMVVLVVASGTVLAGGQLALYEPFWTTPYGKALVAKLAFVAVVLAVGGYNRQFVVPRLSRSDETAAWRHLRATCLIESTTIALGVLLMTAAMTSGGFP